MADIASAQSTIFRNEGLVIVEVIALVVATSDRCASDEDLSLRWVVRRKVSSLRYCTSRKLISMDRKGSSTHGIQPYCIICGEKMAVTVRLLAKAKIVTIMPHPKA